MKTPILPITATLALLLTPHAAADDNLWIAARAGTQGLGLEGTWRPVPYLDLRVGFNTFDYDDTRDEAGIEYDGTLELSSAYATLNARVPLSPFRVSAGFVANGNELSLQAAETGTFIVGDQTFNGADVGTLRGKGTFDSLAPYAGVGLDFRVADTLGLHFDLGVMHQGEAEVSLAADGILAGDPTFASALEAERLELEDAVSDLEWYPVIAVAFSVNF